MDNIPAKLGTSDAIRRQANVKYNTTLKTKTIIHQKQWLNPCAREGYAVHSIHKTSAAYTVALRWTDVLMTTRENRMVYKYKVGNSCLAMGNRRPLPTPSCCRLRVLHLM